MSAAGIRRRVLGVDFGRARIGVAVSDELQMLAHPVETVPAWPAKNALARVAALAREKDVECVVVGLPRHMNGTTGSSAEEALAFAEKLRAKVTCEVRTIDERLTTVAANRALQSAGRKTRDTRGYVDQVAAQMILQSYLDRASGALLPPEPIA